MATAGGEAAADGFRRRFGRAPEVVARAPGRVTFLGAHVDSSEGRVLPGAIDRSVWVAAARREDRLLLLHGLDVAAAERQGRLDLGHLPPPRGERSGAALGWLDYPAGLAWALGEAGLSPAGMEAVVTGDLPQGSGLSSSAALEMAFLLAWEALSGFRLTAVEKARLGRRCENGYLGVRSGVMDQLASLWGTTDHLVLIDCRSLEHRGVPLPPGLAVVLADSGVRRRLAASSFNRRRDELAAATRRLRQRRPGLRTLRDVDGDDLAALTAALPEPLGRRVRHVVEEDARVVAGAAALARGDLKEFAAAVRRSHEGSRDLFAASLPELDTLAEAAWTVPGCHGARFMGGGFGGWVAALCDTAAVEEVGRAMAEASVRRFGRRPEVARSRIAEGAGLEGA